MAMLFPILQYLIVIINEVKIAKISESDIFKILYQWSAIIKNNNQRLVNDDVNQAREIVIFKNCLTI